MRTWGVVRLGLAGLCLAALGCDRGAIAEPSVTLAERASAETTAHGPQAAPPGLRPEVDREGLLIGEFRLADHPVVDGDTIRVEGIEGSIRLLSIDTEEKLRRADRAAVQDDFADYLRMKRGDSARPQKPGTPMGEEATEFAEAFFEGVDLVRLERDDPKEIRGVYGRLLAYVFAKKNGRWTSYNVECVKAGMSPYFTKYGYSHRFHNQLSYAEAEAREAQRGIWNPQSKSYGDYAERKAWWNARAEFIRTFEQEANRQTDYVHLSHFDAAVRLEEKLGQEVSVLGVIDRIQIFRTLVRVSLSAQQSRFPLIFRDRDVFRSSGIGPYRGEPVVVRGPVEVYEKGSYRTLQIVVKDPAQVSLPSLPESDEETEPTAVR